MIVPNSVISKLGLGDEMREIYIHRFIYQLSKKLVAIFIPLYILDLGFSPLYVVGFFMAYFTSAMLSAFPSAVLSSRLGYKKTSLASCPLVLSYYFILRNMTGTTVELLAAALIGGTGVTVYWMGMNPEVAKSSHRDKDDEEAGIFFSIPSISSVIAPMIGAGILAVAGFQILFTTTIGAILLSFIPLALTPEHREGMNLKVREFISNYELYDFLVFLTTGSSWVGQIVVWPLFLATILESAGIGGSGALLALGGAVTSIIAGFMSERIGRKNVLTFGAITAAITFLAMSMVTSPVTAFIVSTANGFFLKFVNIPIYGTVMEHSEDSDLIEYHMIREIGLNTGRIISMGILVASFLLLPTEKAFLTGFILMAALSLLSVPVGWKMIDS
jgi:MFS family permease